MNAIIYTINNMMMNINFNRGEEVKIIGTA